MFFKNGVCDFRIFENKLEFNLDEFIGRNLSTSYAPKYGDIYYCQYIDELTELFNKYSTNGILELPNITRSYAGDI